MNMNKKLIVTSLLAASVFVSAANAGTINITGSITSTPCTATASSSTLKMEDINLNDLAPKTGQTATGKATDFTIKLSGCPAMAQTATVKFTGTADKVEKDALELSGVEGVALKLFEDDGSTAININSDAKSQSLTGSPTHDLNYKLKYVSTASVFKPGTAAGVINFDVAYN